MMFTLLPKEQAHVMIDIATTSFFSIAFAFLVSVYLDIYKQTRSVLDSEELVCYKLVFFLCVCV